MTAVVVVDRVPFPGRRLVLRHGDLTGEAVDAIVNAANPRLAHGGGVAAAIVRRGGLEIQRESEDWVRAHGLADHHRPGLTGPGRLPCRAVIHAVGPVWGSGDEDRKLATAYTAALDLAHDQAYRTVAFPSISTGIFGFPVDRAATIAVGAVTAFWRARADSTVAEVRFTIIDLATVEVFRRAVGAVPHLEPA